MTNCLNKMSESLNLKLIIIAFIYLSRSGCIQKTTGIYNFVLGKTVLFNQQNLC